MLWVPAGLAGVPAASHGRVLGLPSFRLSRLGHRRANRCVGWTLTLKFERLRLRALSALNLGRLLRVVLPVKRDCSADNPNSPGDYSSCAHEE